METLQVTARATIQPGKLEEFRSLAAECLRITREKDQGTLQYDWFLDETQAECVVRETYRDSGAVLAHIIHLGATFGALLAIGDWSFEVYGSPSAELVAATAGLRVKVYAPLQSL